MLPTRTTEIYMEIVHVEIVQKINARDMNYDMWREREKGKKSIADFGGTTKVCNNKTYIREKGNKKKKEKKGWC